MGLTYLAWRNLLKSIISFNLVHAYRLLVHITFELLWACHVGRRLVNLLPS